MVALKRQKVGVGIALGMLALAIVLVGLFNHSPRTEANAGGGHRDSNGSQGSYWSLPDARFKSSFTAKGDSRFFAIGDSITMPNGLQIQVTKVERDWQPSAAMAGVGKQVDGDSINGREIILVWFKATDVGSSNIVYNDYFFSLQRPNKPEQRLAKISALPSSSYGDYGKSPWLVPGESTTTFLPFLVSQGETLVSFQYYYAPKQGEVYRLSVLLKEAATTSSSGTRSAATSSSGQYIFQGDQDVTVR